MATDIEQIQTALTEFDRVGAGLAQLTQNYKGIVFEVDTPKGMEAAKAARLALRNPRYEVERIRKAAKAPIIAVGKHLDAEAARITAEIMKLEDPIDQQIKNEEDRKEKEKQAAIDAENARIAAIQARLAEIRRLPVLAGGKTSAHARAVMQQAYAIDLHGLGPEGDEAMNTTMHALNGVIAEREAFEAEQVRVAEERKELARLRAEDEARQEARRKEQAAEQARLQEEFRRQQEELNRQRAEQEAAAQAERNRLAAEERAAREAREAEEARIAGERKKLADEQEAQRKQREAEDLAKRQSQRPSDEEIVAALTAHFRVSSEIVRKWLGWEKVKAA